MALPDISTLTGDELRELVNAANVRLFQQQQDEEATEEQLRAQIAATITGLDALIGPNNPTVKSAATLAQANLYTAPELAAATGVAHDAQLTWLLTIARTVRDLARVVSGTIE